MIIQPTTSTEQVKMNKSQRQNEKSSSKTREKSAIILLLKNDTPLKLQYFKMTLRGYNLECQSRFHNVNLCGLCTHIHMNAVSTYRIHANTKKSMTHLYEYTGKQIVHIGVQMNKLVQECLHTQMHIHVHTNTHTLTKHSLLDITTIVP